jgi:hypothetical protein
VSIERSTPHRGPPLFCLAELTSFIGAPGRAVNDHRTVAWYPSVTESVALPPIRGKAPCPSLNLFFTQRDAVKGNAVMVTLGEMKNSEKFRFMADGADPPP